MATRNIRSQVLIPLTLTFIILSGSFVYSSYWMRMAHHEKALQHRHQRVQHILKNLVDDRTRFMTSSIEFIAVQKQFQEAMRLQDRSTLLELGLPILKQLFRNQHITHFYFYDKNGATVLRVYNPDDISASPMRYTRQQAMALGEVVSGLELGRSGTFTLRVVYPWKVNNELIGYIELGQEYEHILQELKLVTLLDFAVVLKKKYLDRGAWEQGMKMLGHTADWNLLPDEVLVDQTVTTPPSIVAALLATDADSRKYGKQVRVKDRTLRVAPFPLQDAAHRTVGEFVTMMDTTSTLSELRAFISKVLAFSMLVCGALFLYSFRVLGQLDLRLVENRKQLEKEIEKQAATNKLLEIEVGERQLAEDKLVALNEHLEQRVLDRTSELHRLNQQMAEGRNELEEAYKSLKTQQTAILQQDRMACIGQLAASVAHDINNPIGFVTGNLEVLKQYWGKFAAFLAVQDQALRSCAPTALAESVAEQRRRLKVDGLLDEFDAVLDESLEGAERVGRIVLNLKGFSRQDGKEARPVNIHDCLESTLKIVMNELRYKADIKKEYGDVPQLLCYPQQLNQVFMNLLINASQSIKDWGEIVIRTWSDREHVFVAIADTGCGIDKEHLPKLFEPFFTTKQPGVGTGLGLSIVMEIIKKHRGEVMVESVPGQGTVFTVRLPLEGPPREADRA